LSIIGWYALSIFVDYGLGFHPPLTYAVPETFVLWLAVGLTTALGAALLLLPSRLSLTARDDPAPARAG
jgi:hypothetical protein